MARKFKTARERKEFNSKIAEIIWLSIAGLIIFVGLLGAVAGLLINSMSGNFKSSPLYFLIEAQEGFFTWVKTWWEAYALTTFDKTGLVLMGIGLVLLLIVLLVYSNKEEAREKKEKARKLRESNVKRFEAQLENLDANKQ
jgi:hypothetical protein